MFKRVYNRFFYAIMLNYMKLHSGNRHPKIDDISVAIIIISCFLYCVVLTMMMFLYVCGFEICGFLRHNDNSVYYEIGFAVIILAFNIAYFLKKKRYQIIFDFYQQTENERTRKRNSLYCLAFVLILLIFMIVNAYFYDKKGTWAC